MANIFGVYQCNLQNPIHILVNPAQNRKLWKRKPFVIMQLCNFAVATIKFSNASKALGGVAVN